MCNRLMIREWFAVNHILILGHILIFLLTHIEIRWLNAYKYLYTNGYMMDIFSPHPLEMDGCDWTSMWWSSIIIRDHQHEHRPMCLYICRQMFALVFSGGLPITWILLHDVIIRWRWPSSDHQVSVESPSSYR